MDNRGDKIAYLMEMLDFNLEDGMEPEAAWAAALKSYARVFFGGDDDTQFARSEAEALGALKRHHGRSSK